ncbi:CAP domain-containing protein [Georgenia sp. M64]|uniref:CAP domain-containing protein n=1 Tax=Georgenia sp. M64 TaxID=3120520 RepID=UPI0030DDE355
MRTGVLAAALGALLAGCSGVTSSPAPAASATADSPASATADSPASATADPAAYAEDLFARTNDERAGLDLEPLEPSECAQQAATQRAEALVGGDELVHAPMQSLLEECGVDRAAENLVRSDATAEEVVAAWMDSPGHRNNIVDPDMTALGIGCVPDGAELLCSQIYLRLGG